MNLLSALFMLSPLSAPMEEAMSEIRVGKSVILTAKSSASTPIVERKDDQVSLVYTHQFPKSGSGRGAEWALTHNIASAKSVWIPHVSPYADTVIGDHSLRSPAIVIGDQK